MKSSGLVLFACSGLLLSGGAILGGVTAWCLLCLSYYFWTTDLGLELGSGGVLFITGALLCLPACWLCTIVPYHTKSHPLKAILMSLVSMSMLLLSLGLSSSTALSQAVRDPAKVNASMHQAMANTDPAVKSSFAAMQLERHCCGVNSYADWYRYGSSLPPSCCGLVWNGKRAAQCKVPVGRTGCLPIALLELRAYINSISIVASAVIPVLGVTLFTVAYMVVTGVLERSEGLYKAQPMRIACLAQAPLMSLAPTLQSAPFMPPTPQPQIQPAPALM